MSAKIRAVLLISALLACFFTAGADENDYIAGVKAYADGLYSISALSLEAYLSDGKDSQKADYSRYLLYHIYMKDNQNGKAYSYFKDIKNRNMNGMDTKQMDLDNMIMLTGTDCAQAQTIAKSGDDAMLDIYLGSKCPVDSDFIKDALAKAKSDNTKLRIVTRVTDKPDLVRSVFDSMDVSKMPDSAKKYFGTYFYQNKDYPRFLKVRKVYEDKDMVGDELDMYWTKGQKDQFINNFEKYRSKYEVGSANNCRAIDTYNDKGESFDCMIVDQCMDEKTVDFVKIKGACLAKNGDGASLTSFVDSLSPSIFTGICSYGEYIFANGLYTGKDEKKFRQCDNRYNIADVMLQRQQYRDLVNMFSPPESDVDRYYAAIGLKGIGNDAAAERTAMKIKDNYIKSKLAGGTK